MKIAGFINQSTTNGPGLRKVLFVQGCHHHCKGCHNKHTWDPNAGTEMFVDEVYDMIIKTNSFIKKITISGGEPFDQLQDLLELVKRLKDAKYHIMVYTGFTFEELIDSSMCRDVLNYIDMLVDGPFIEELKTSSIKYIGSSNQRIIQLK